MSAYMASVRMMESSIGSVSHLVAQCESQQEERTSNFTTDIEKSIETLRSKATELRADSENKMLFDGATEMPTALGFSDPSASPNDSQTESEVRTIDQLFPPHLPHDL